MSFARPGLENNVNDVWLHVYNMDSCTAYLNRMGLRKIGLGLFHVGVEVLGTEWSFQYYADGWEEDDLCGVMDCVPRQMEGSYIYRESVYMGRTPLDMKQVQDIIEEMKDRWPANGYHLTKRNCITFAQEFVISLRLECSRLPNWLVGLVKLGSCCGIGSIVDCAWSCAKWYMIRQHRPDRKEWLKLQAESKGQTLIRVREELDESLKRGEDPKRWQAAVDAVEKELLALQRELAELEGSRRRWACRALARCFTSLKGRCFPSQRRVA